MSPRHRPAHRRLRRRRSHRLFAAMATLVVIGVAVVLGDRYGPAVAAAIRDETANSATVVAPSESGTSTGPTSAMQPGSSTPLSTNPAVPPQSAGPTAVTSLDIPFPHSGPRTFHYATTTGSILGKSGPIRRFRLAMESNIDVVSMRDFAAKVNETLGDPRSWIAGGTYRLQQVPPTSSYEFTIYLVTSKTTSAMCAPLQTNGFTSCRQGPHVVLNLDRYMTSVSGYRTANISLETYRTYMINHEVGHQLGHNHELCPSPGALAPVMEQQTLGLHGCKPNAWPYVGGKKYDGPPGSY